MCTKMMLFIAALALAVSPTANAGRWGYGASWASGYSYNYGYSGGCQGWNCGGQGGPANPPNGPPGGGYGGGGRHGGGWGGGHHGGYGWQDGWRGNVYSYRPPYYDPYGGQNHGGYQRPYYQNGIHYNPIDGRCNFAPGQGPVGLHPCPW